MGSQNTKQIKVLDMETLCWIFCQQQANSDAIDSRQLGQEETPPHPIYPQSGYGILPGDDIIPIRDGGTLLFLELSEMLLCFIYYIFDIFSNIFNTKV